MSVTRFAPNSLHYTGMRESDTGEYVRYEDYQALQARCTKLEAALQPLADKWLYPDDLGEPYAMQITDDDYNAAENEDTSEECWIKRAWVRAARLALSL